MGSRLANTNTAPNQIAALSQSNLNLNLKALKKTTAAKPREAIITTL